MKYDPKLFTIDKGSDQQQKDPIKLKTLSQQGGGSILLPESIKRN